MVDPSLKQQANTHATFLRRYLLRQGCEMATTPDEVGIFGVIMFLESIADSAGVTQMMSTADKVAESNRIEDILRPPTYPEVEEFERFMRLEEVTIAELEQFVKVYEPNARMRDQPGLDVRVGNHFPPRGGPHIVEQLKALLDDANAKRYGAWDIHLQYEALHPFTDGNGRSGRMLWYWMMGSHPFANIGFLHAFYYQTFSGTRR